MPFNLKSKGLTISVFLQPANEVWGKVMFLHLSVSHSVHRGLPRGCLHPGDVCIQEGLPPGGGGLDRPSEWILRDTVNERAVRILLECILLRFM